MNALTKPQTISRPDGAIEYVILPYADYLALLGKAEGLIPDEVVNIAMDTSCSAIRAWREHLGLTQAEMASRLGISQPAYAEQEASSKLRKGSKEKIARALGVTVEQLNF